MMQIPHSINRRPVVEFPPFTADYIPGILSEDYLGRLQGKSLELETDVVYDGLRNISMALALGQAPSETDAQFASAADMYLLCRAKSEPDSRKSGLLYMLGEDALALMAIAYAMVPSGLTAKQSLKNEAEASTGYNQGWAAGPTETSEPLPVKTRSKWLGMAADFGIPHFRAEAHRLLAGKPNASARIVNATQEMHVSRLRGMRKGAPHMTYWAARLMVASNDRMRSKSIHEQLDIVSASVGSLATVEAARQAFLHNFSRHRANNLIQ